MFGLTTLGTIHTAISLVAVLAGLVALARDKEISTRNHLGRIFVVGTILSCLTGFGIFQHGGFGKPHALGVLTLVVLAVALAAEYGRLFGRAARYVEVIGYSTAFFFHFIPGATETLTRLPLGAPLLPNAEAPELQVIVGVLFIMFLAGVGLQMLRLRGARPAMSRPQHS